MRIFDRIAIEFPEKEVFLRLGGNSFKTVLAGGMTTEFARHCAKAYAAVAPCGRYKVSAISLSLPDVVVCDGEEIFLGRDFVSQAEGAEYLWCGAVSIGHELEKLMEESDSMSLRAIYDASGSECADAAMDVLFHLAGNELLRRGLVLSPRRFSPGYGDMPLVLQKFFYHKLNMAEMGVTLTEKMFLVPEKSVTAFAFIHSLQGKSKNDQM